MLHYILQTIAFQLFFLVIYDLFLKKETFFHWNRFYLLFATIISLILPFIQVESIREVVPQQFVIRLPEVIIGNVQSNDLNTIDAIQADTVTTSEFIWSWGYLLYVGMLIAGSLFAYKLNKMNLLIQKNSKRWKGNLIIVNLLNSKDAFSFFNYVFLGEQIEEEERQTILKHELVHVTQKHSLDLMLFEILRILFWFNPLVYMYQNRMTTLHEYIADEHAIKQIDKKQYYENLLSQVFDTKPLSFTNTFFNQSLIKKRIVMLSKSKSNRLHLLKYALLIPMVFGMLLYTSSYSQELSKTNSTHEDMANQKLSDEELKKKLYNEIVAMEKNGAGFKEIYDFIMPTADKYINTRTEHYKLAAYFDYIMEKSIDRKIKEGSLTDEDVEKTERMKETRKTYQEYLDWKKTDEAKTQWESKGQDGELRLVVDDMKNMTEEEKKRQQEKIDLILKDDFFHTLFITDGKSSTKMVVDSIDGKTKPAFSQYTVKDDIEYDIEVPFSHIEKVPTTLECKDLATNEEKRQCFSDYIVGFVNTNFNTKMAKEIGLTGKQRISVIFKIGKDGNIKDIKARAPHPKLEEEAIRVIKALPQFIPGEQKGNKVVVPYSLPIIFQVAE